MRRDGRLPDQLRPLTLSLDFTDNPLASVLCELGRTKVLCTVCAEESVPRFLQGSGEGWITAEYSMLPGSTDRRSEREAARGRPSGRTQEIQRLIGRSLRAVADLEALGERTFYVDCDVLQADGGTRTASIIGGYVALAHALRRLQSQGVLKRAALREGLAAISVGLVAGEAVLDLSYEEDVRAEVDFNVVATASGRLAELQGTGESATFSREQLDAMISLALRGIAELTQLQEKALAVAKLGDVSDSPLVVVATGNSGKLAELRALLAELPIRVAGLGEVPALALPEEGDDYAANAAAKAREAARALGVPALADDSGIEVLGLGGAPGPRSARFGGAGLDDAARTALLLRELAARPAADRRARFVCVAALALPGGALRSARGSCAGRIAEAPRGGSGFGYDPVFVPDEQETPGRFTLAELSPEEKARISHRGRAVRALLPAFAELVLGASPQSPAAKRS